MKRVQSGSLYFGYNCMACQSITWLAVNSVLCTNLYLINQTQLPKYSRVIVVLKKKKFKFDAAIPIFTQSRYMLVVVGSKSGDLYFNVDFDYFLKLKYIIWNLDCLIST